jgi:protein-S-isoprenylcysteine O-methyltransferase Ste14
MSTPRNLTVATVVLALFIFGAAMFVMAAEAIREARLKRKLGDQYEGPASE